MRLILLVLGWTAGILFTASLPQRSPSLWLVLSALSALLFFIWRHTQARFPLLIALVFALGALRLSLTPADSAVAAFNNSGGLTLEGVVIAQPELRDTSTRLRLAVDTVTQAGQTRATDGLVLVEAGRTEAAYGDRVRATGLLITPGETDTFSYADYLARSGVFSILTNTSTEVASSGSGSAITSFLIDLRRRAYESIAAALPEPQAGLLAGILLGDERGIAPGLEDDFAATGAAHIIAISGFNMVIVGETIRRVLTALRVRPNLAAVLAVIFVILYAVFVGSTAVVTRAALMTILLIIAERLRRKTYVPTSLAFAALLVTLDNPLTLWDVGFQLSFAATLGLALFATPVTSGIESVFRRVLPASAARPLAALLGVTLAAQITTTPLIALYFGRLSVVILVVNLLVVPIQPLILFTGGLATLIAGLAPAVAQVLYWLCLVPLSWTIEVVRAFARLPFAETEVSVHPVLVTLFFAALASGGLLHAAQPGWALRLGRLIKHRLVATTTLTIGVSIAALVAAIALSRPDGKLHVWMLDVGHSNAVLVQTPGGAQMLVDGGRFPSRLLTAIGDRLPFNDREIELMVLTQPNPFEIGGASAVAARYSIKAVLTNGQPSLDEAYLSLLDSLHESDIVPVSAGYTLDVSDGTRLEVLHPQAAPQINDSLDDQTLVLRLTYGEISFLLTSDLSREGQTALLENGQWPLATVMQLPQHGAARSLDDAFLEAVQPQVILLQSDRANRNGDPDADTLAKLGDTPVYRTDGGGTLHIWTDGAQLWAQPERTSTN